MWRNDRHRNRVRVGIGLSPTRLDSASSASGVSGDEAEETNGHNTERKHRTITKLDVIPWVYTLYCACYLALVVFISAFESGNWAEKTYYIIVAPTNLVEGLCLAVIVYPFAARASQSTTPRWDMSV
ncbi:hypothetical protein KIPB_002068 [Kipferlia bialata]|uniref:Transmembrane protein n=1 Tax=Kipferlia bialata TaxID=797122 RepID=A0A9K3CT11_9EUKA|nr:hypothetical protein KIPB_002068 [Kipferlia bialata]|eukprot:g2068.t1